MGSYKSLVNGCSLVCAGAGEVPLGSLTKKDVTPFVYRFANPPKRSTPSAQKEFLCVYSAGSEIYSCVPVLTDRFFRLFCVLMKNHPMYPMLVLLGLAALLGKSGVSRCLAPNSWGQMPCSREVGDIDAPPHPLPKISVATRL